MPFKPLSWPAALWKRDSPVFHCLVLGVVSGLWLLLLPNPLAPWERRFLDETFRWRLALKQAPAVDPRIVYLMITDKEVAEFHSVSEEYAGIARLVDEATALGAEALVFDVVFQRAKETDALILYQAVVRSRRVVLAEGWQETAGPPGAGQRVRSLPFKERLLPAGLINVEPDPDGVYRHYAYVQRHEEHLEPSLALTAYCACQQIQWPEDFKSLKEGRIRWEELASDNVSMAVRTLDSKPQLLNFRSGWLRSDPTSFGRITPAELHAQYAQQQGSTNQTRPAPLAGTVLLVSYVASGIADTGPTPFGSREPLVQLHATALNDLFQHRFLRTLPGRLESLLVLSVVGFGWGAGFCTRKRWLALFWLGMTALWVGAGLFVFCRYGLTLPVVTVGAVWTGACILELVRRHSREWFERFKLRRTMELYFSPGVIEHVLAKPGALEPQAADLAVLLSDLRNYTSITERSRPQEVYDLLNRVYSIDTRTVHSRNGNLIHYVGDQFAAYWGAPRPEPLAADLALAAALEMIVGLEVVRRELPPAWQGLFDYGIGIHFGPALVGNVGGTERLDYMVLGDVINTTARIESLTKLYGVRLLVTRQVRSKLSRPPPARMLDRVIPKGKTEALELWEPAHSLSPVNFASLTDHYAAAWGLYEAGKFLEASAAFAALARDFSDPPSRTMAARCQEFMHAPPPDWQGIYKLEAK
jgi:class 3 adenylate cyclase